MLDNFWVTIVRDIDWGEMDAFNHVNNAVYFRFFENARIAYFNKIGIIEEMKYSGVGPILKSASCTYRIPLVFPDTITIGARVTTIEADHFLMKYAILSHRHKKIAAEGESMVVSLNYRTNEKSPLPQSVIDAINCIEKRLVLSN